MAYQHFCVKIYFSFNLNGPIKKKIVVVLHQDLFDLNQFCIKIYFTSVCFVS